MCTSILHWLFTVILQECSLFDHLVFVMLPMLLCSQSISYFNVKRTVWLKVTTIFLFTIVTRITKTYLCVAVLVTLKLDSTLNVKIM